MASSPTYSNSSILKSSTFELTQSTITSIASTSSDNSLNSSPLGEFVSSTLTRIGKTLHNASAGQEDPLFFESKLKEAVQSTAALAKERISPDQQAQIEKVKNQINQLLLEVNNDIRNSPIYRTPTPKPKKTVAQRIEEHNNKALETIPLLKKTSYPFSYYPKADEREKYKKQIDLIPSTKTLVYPDQIALGSSKMGAAKVLSAQAIGKRDYMEDYKMASSFYFVGKEGNIHEAEIACVCDGHGGKDVPEYVVANLKDILQKELVSRLSLPVSRDPTQEDIFLALKETVKTLHRNVCALDLEGGTTAIISFKFENKLYTANIGDSRAFINRNGKLIPMSIDQKPYGIRQEHIQEGTQLNEYAHQIIVKKRLEVVNDKQIDEELKTEVANQDRMVVSHLCEENGIDYFRLGITNVRHIDMVRSIGDKKFDAFLIRSPEIFCQDILPGDQLILHSDGIPVDPQSLINIMETEKMEGVSLEDTVVRLVQASIPDDDNITLMVITLDSPTSEKTEKS